MNNAPLALRLSVLDENVVGSGQMGGSSSLMVLYGVTTCISVAISFSACDIH